MDLDELRSAQSRERQASQLQHLRDGFYEEAATFIRGLRTERERAAAQTDYSFPYDDPEVQRLTNEIQTAEEVVESLYERRVGKVVKMASFDAAGMAVDAEGLTTEEADLFETLVGDIEANRERVLDALAGTAGGDDGASPASAATDAEAGAPDAAASPGGTDTAPSAPDTAAGDEDRGESDPAAEESVHLGSGPAADGPVSTADAEASDSESTPERSPTPGPERREGETATAAERPDPPRESMSQDGPERDGSGAADGAESDAMDAASAMGGAESDTTSDAASGQTGDVASGQSSGTPERATEQSASSAASGTATSDDPDHQPVPPADGPTGDESAEPGAAAGVETGDAGGNLGAGSAAAPSDVGETADADPPRPGADTASGVTDEGTGPDGSSVERETGGEEPDASAADAGAAGTLVRVTGDVGEIFGVDGRAYDLSAGDVVVLPADNAAPLVEEGTAERLESAVPFSGGQS